MCLRAPAGQEAFFAAVGEPRDGPNNVPPTLNAAALAEKSELLGRLAPTYRPEVLE